MGTEPYWRRWKQHLLDLLAGGAQLAAEGRSSTSGGKAASKLASELQLCSLATLLRLRCPDDSASTAPPLCRKVPNHAGLRGALPQALLAGAGPARVPQVGALRRLLRAAARELRPPRQVKRCLCRSLPPHMPPPPPPPPPLTSPPASPPFFGGSSPLPLPTLAPFFPQALQEYNMLERLPF